MVKFSDFIRAPGTAGPPTQQGIYALGFALRDEIIELLGKFVRVDAAQSFSAGEKTQGRANIGAQEASASLTSLAGLTTAADQLAYTTAPDTWAVTTLTPFARTILEDANAAAVRTTIGLGNVDNTSDANKPVSTATQAALNLKANLAGPAFTGVPTAPTAAIGTSTTQLATTAFVQAASGTIVLGAVATTSGTTIEFNSIPAGVRCVKVLLRNVRLSGSAQVAIQLGTASSFETTGYISGLAVARDGLATIGYNSSTRFVAGAASSATVGVDVTVTFHRLDGNEWLCEVGGGVNNNGSPISQGVSGGGEKTLAGELTRLRLTSSNDTDTFTTGKANVFCEF